MIHREPPVDTVANRVRHRLRLAGGSLVQWGWRQAKSVGSIGPDSAAGRSFDSFGPGSIMCFPQEPFVNPGSIHLGTSTMIGPNVVLSAGWGPDHPGLPDRVVVIGDRCLIGRGSSVVGHRLIEIGDDVWTGQQVHITDMNHGYERLDVPIAAQNQPESPIRIGDGTWLGHHVVVLPGVTIGRHVVVGAGSVVTEDLPDYCVAVGSPARVIRRYLDGEWVRVP